MRTIVRSLTMSLMFLVVLQADVFSQSKLKIAVIPKKDNIPYWNAIRHGAQAAALAAGGIEFNWKPPKDQTVAQQIEIIDKCVADGFDGIALAPLDYSALVAPVARATKKGITVVIFDSKLKGEAGKDFTCFIGTDSRNGGMLAGQEMAKAVGEKGKVIVLHYSGGETNLNERYEGFARALQEFKDIRLEVVSRPGHPTVADASAAGASMVEKLKNADGLFCESESATTGMLEALQKAGLAGKLKFIGFDTSVELVQALGKGEVHALIAQDPTKIGYFAVKATVDRIRGAKISPATDTGVRVVTRANVDDPEIQKLLSLPGMVK